MRASRSVLALAVAAAALGGFAPATPDAPLPAVPAPEARAERRRLQERTSGGRVEAREKGVRFGRKPSVDRALVQELRRQGLGATDVARQLHIGRSTVYTILHSGQRDEPEDAP